MKNKFIIKIGVLALMSTSLLALDGPHGSIGTSLDNGEICVYCHTPHAANLDAGTPLWNKPTSSLVTSLGNAYPMYGSTIAGTTTTAQPTDQTLACLGCHDGVSAMNSVVNAPGSGRYDINGINIGYNDPNYQKPMTDTLLAIGAVNLSVNNNGLENDHPVSIQYIPGRASLRPTSATLVGTYGWLGATTVGDLLRGPNNDMVHCTSCHDPHNLSNGTYLRATNNNSELCFGCHDK